MIRFYLIVLLLSFSVFAIAQHQPATVQLPDTTSHSNATDSNNVPDSLQKTAVKKSEKMPEYTFTLPTTNVRKQKRDALMNIGIGIFFMVVLVVGLARRRKKKTG